MPDFVLSIQGQKPFSGILEIDQPPQEWPDPFKSVEGVVTYLGFDYARSRGWSELHPKYDQTNMVWPQFYLVDGQPVFSKDIIRLDKRKYWVDDVYRPWMGDLMWGLYCQPKFWRQDTNDTNTNPVTGIFKEQTIDTGCNLHHLVGEPFWTKQGLYQQVEGVDYFSHIDISKINYKLRPDLVEKQTLASKSANEPVAYITHQTNGDLVVPKIQQHPLIMPNGVLERFPQLPFTTTYMGTQVTLEAFCFQASTVFGLFPDGWRVIETSHITGIGSAFFDREVMVGEWLETPPPTIKGYTRGMNEPHDWQVPNERN